MSNCPPWKDQIKDPPVSPVEEINRIKQIYDSENLTKSHWDWNYQQQLANNTFSLKYAFDSVISILERSYYHDMLESELISGFYQHIGSTDKLVATNTDPDDYRGGDLDRIPLNHLEPRSRGREISLLPTEETHNGNIVNNPITHRAQPDAFEDFYGKDLAANPGVTWFRYVWNWEHIDPLDRDLFERTKLLYKWLNKNTFCHYHDIFQHSILVYINGLPVNDFEVMFTDQSNLLKLPFDNKVFMDIQKGNPVPLTIYRIASKKQYWANLTYVQMMDHNGQWDATTWDDYSDLFEDGNSDLVILNLCERKTNNNIAYRDQQKTEMMQGPQTIFLHLHKREDGTNYLDIHDIDPEVLSWWQFVGSVTADIIRPKNMVEYTADGSYPYLIRKDIFPDDTTESPATAYNREYTPIDLTSSLSQDNGQFIGVSEEDFLLFKQYHRGSKPGRDQINDGWRPTVYNVKRTYPNTFRVDDGTIQNDIVEIRPYQTHYDALNDLHENTTLIPDISVTQVDVDQSASQTGYPELRVFYFTKTLYTDTILEPIALQALKTARRYVFNPYRYAAPLMKNLPIGTEFTITELGVTEEPYIVIAHDTPIKGQTLCIRKYAIPDQHIENDYMDFYQEEFTTPTPHTEIQSGDRYHLYGRFGIPSLQFFTVSDIPYHASDTEDLQYIHTRFFDFSSEDPSSWMNEKQNRICALREDPTTPVKWRLRDQSDSVKTYGKPHERPAYQYIDEQGTVRDDMQPNEKLYLRPCILIDNEFNFMEHQTDIHITLPEELTPYPLTNLTDQELLKVITTNRQYFLKYFKLLFPGENYYGVEKFYRYSDDNMANLMYVAEPLPPYDTIGNDVVGTPSGDGSIVLDNESVPNVVDNRYWHVTKATIAYLPDKVDPHHTENGWKKNYTIGTHIQTENGVDLIVNMAKYHDYPSIVYKKSLTIWMPGSGYKVSDTLFLRSQSNDTMTVKVTKVDESGAIQEVQPSVWSDTISWNSVNRADGGHGQNARFQVLETAIPGSEEGSYYPYVGMELHIEHDQIYTYDPSGTFLDTAVINGTGEGMQVNIESEHIPFQKEADRDMWMYPFDYLTLKLKNFIYLHPDNFTDYLRRQYELPYTDWSIRVLQDVDLAEYKRYHKGNFLTYNAYIDLTTSMNYVEFLMPLGYHSRLSDIKVYREYDVYSTGDEFMEYDGKTVPIRVYGKRLMDRPDDTGEIFDHWTVSVLNSDGEWVEVTDPNYDVTTGFRLHHKELVIYHADTIPDGWEIPDITECTVHMEFLSIRDSVRDGVYQEEISVEEFDQPKFLVRFDNEPNTQISYRPIVAGFQKDFAELVHIEESDYVYCDWKPIYQLKNSHLDKPPEHHKLYKLRDSKITVDTVSGLHFHPGMELHLAPVDTQPDYYDKVQILAIVDRVLPNPINTVLELHIHDFQRVFLDYNPTGDWKVIPTDFQRADDKFHIGVGEQNSYDDWERIHWFSDPSNKESTDTPIIHLDGIQVEEQWVDAERHFVSVNNTFTLRKLFHYDWEETFSLTDDTDSTLNPTDNPYNELHLEDLKIINTDTNEIVPYDIGDGQELFTLQDIIPDVNRSIQYRPRYDLKQIRINEAALNMRQFLYDITDAETTSLRSISDIRRTFTISRVNINPNASERISCPIVLDNIEPGNSSNCMDSYYIPESIFRKEWNLPVDVVFDHRDYTLYQQPFVDTTGKIIFYADMDLRHTTLPFNFHLQTELINNYNQPIQNNRPVPIGPSSSSWTSVMRYYPSTDEYVANYLSNGGISPSNVPDIVWKPDRYDFPFQIGTEVTPAIIAKGTNSHVVENSYIRIKHIYNIHPAEGIQTVNRQDTIPSPSSHYNNHAPNAYTMGDLLHPNQIDQNDRSSYHRDANQYSYQDPPIFIHLANKMKPYTGIVFNYSDGYDKKLLKIGPNTIKAHIQTDTDVKEVSFEVYVGRREFGPPPDGTWIEQDAYQQTRPSFDGQNYQHKYNNIPHHLNNGRGQYEQQVMLETYYDPIVSYTSATNFFSGNYGNPNFYYPEEENPVYNAPYIIDDMMYLDIQVANDDHYYPTFSEKYIKKVHENSMRNAGYNDSDYTAYYAQFAVWIKDTEFTIQGGKTDEANLSFVEDWITVSNSTPSWDYDHESTLNTEKEFTLDLYANMDEERDSIHHENVHHNHVHITLWQSPEPKEGFIQHIDSETGVVYSIKIETEKPERQFIPWKILGNYQWKLTQSSITDNWWNHVNKPFNLPYSIHGTLETRTGVEETEHVLHEGNYWVYITPKLNYKGAVNFAGTKSEVEAQSPENGDSALILNKDQYQTAVYQKDHWEYTDITPEDCFAYTALLLIPESCAATLLFIHGEFVEYEDTDITFSPEGDRYELYAETRMYKIYTAYERGIIALIHSYTVPRVQCHDLSYLYGTSYSNSIFRAIYEERLYAGLRYFYDGYQKFFVQIVSTLNDELMWIPMWTYIGDGTPPYDEDDPHREWHLIDQEYVNLEGNSLPVYVAYHKEQFPKDIPDKIKESHHTYIDKTTDIYYTCIVTSRHVRQHAMAVYPTPRYSVHELSMGLRYTDIQGRLRITGPSGNYKAIIHLSPMEVSTTEDSMRHPIVRMNTITTHDRLTVRATKKDGPTYDVPLVYPISEIHPLETINQEHDHSDIQYHGIKPNDMKWTFVQNPYPKNTIYAQRHLPSHGVIQLDHLKHRVLRSQLDSDRYEIIVNGRILTHHDQYTIISPTKFIMHGLTSLHNLEINEINREPSKEFFRPVTMRDTMDAILEANFIDGSYQHEFNKKEQSDFLPDGVYPQLPVDDKLYLFYPINVDMDPDIRELPDDLPEEYLETDYRYLSDYPYLEGVSIYSNSRLGEYKEYPDYGMKILPISNQDISNQFQKGFTEKVDDGRHAFNNSPIHTQFRIMWDPIYQSEQRYQLPYAIQKTSYESNYLKDDRYKDHFPQYSTLFGKDPLLLERDWVRYRASIPNTPIRDTFHMMWQKEYHYETDWTLSSQDPQVSHGSRYNWKGWQEHANDKSSYVLWKMNSKANPEKPWENQVHPDYYEPDMVYVEQDPNHYYSYLGSYIQAHYDAFIDSTIGSFRGYNGWYPWKNPDAPFLTDHLYWDTDRIKGKVGGLTMSPYSVQVNNNISRSNPEVRQYKYISDTSVKLYLDGVYEGEYSKQPMDHLNEIRLLVYNANTDELAQDILLPNAQPESVTIDHLDPNMVYDVYVDFANRAGIRHGKKIKIDPMFR